MQHVYFLFVLFLLVLSSYAEFSSDATNPLAVCNEASGQSNVTAVNDIITPKGGYFVFWIDKRIAGDKAQLYGQRLDKNGNKLWETNGRPIKTKASNITAFTATNWNKGILLLYVVNQDSIKCMYLNANGTNIWTAPSVIATGGISPVLYVSAGGCLNAFPTATGASITYQVAFFGGATAIGYNKINFNGNRLLGNNAVTYQFSGYDYRSVSDGQNGVYVLSKGNGLGSTITIDRINSSGGKVWSTGVEITDGGGSLGFAGNISMNIDTNHHLYITWDAYNGNVLHTKVLKTGSLAWAFKRRAMSTAATPNAYRCFARIKNNIAFITWLESANNATHTMMQKISSSGSLSLPTGGKKIGEANYYYAYPKLAFGGDNAVSFFSANTSSTVGIDAQGLKPNNSLLWSTPKTVCDAYLKWNFYQDFVVLDSTNACNTIFWTGFDGNIYGANTCKIANVLPITTGSTKVETIGMRNKISWTSYNESTGSNYEVERSLDGRSFVAIATVQAKGANSSYIYWDETATAGNYFYRIKLIDPNDKTEYSNIVEAAINIKKEFTLSVYPNPVSNSLHINLNLSPGKNATITICDISGRIIKALPINSSLLTVDVASLSKGMYVLMYKDDSRQAAIKIEKQ